MGKLANNVYFMLLLGIVASVIASVIYTFAQPYFAQEKLTFRSINTHASKPDCNIINRSINFLENGEFDKALTVTDSIILINRSTQNSITPKQNSIVHLIQGLSHFNLKQYRKALSSLNKSNNFFPNHSAHEAISTIYFNLNEKKYSPKYLDLHKKHIDKALELLKNRVSLSPLSSSENTSLQIGLATNKARYTLARFKQIDASAKDVSESFTRISKLLKNNHATSNVNFRNNIGVTSTGNTDTVHSWSYISHYRLGSTYQLMGELGNGMNDYSSVNRVSNNDLAYYLSTSKATPELTIVNDTKSSLTATVGIRNKANHGYSDGSFINFDASKNGKVYLLSIGVNSFDDNNIQTLNYSEKDSVDVIDSYKKVFPNKLVHYSLLGVEANKENIISKLKLINDMAGVDDRVYVYYAGHGSQINNRFNYLLPADAKVNDLQRTAISMSYISSILGSKNREIKPILITDICNDISAPQKTNGLPAPYTTVSDNGHGSMVVISSSSDGQSSAESSKLQNGIFTHFLTKRLDDIRSLNSDKPISINKFFGAIQTDVSAYSEDIDQNIQITFFK